ncbi:lachesin-like, partial [Diaphorina citri]|uniref:Lachesin-like n=1 Tax=Diaphorina citri TaxID=121845 RepID=A0A3Q0JDN5_DIACI
MGVTSPSNGQLTVRKGGTITLECKASGNPVPSIIWSKKDSSLPSGEKSLEGFSITLEKVDRHQAGVYQCTATNGVGDPVTVDMTLEVLCFSITLEKVDRHQAGVYQCTATNGVGDPVTVDMTLEVL